MGNTELSEKLGIKKQNISRWFKGERKIPEKYLTKLSEIFEIDASYFQKELNEIDKLEIQKIRLENSIGEEEYRDLITDPDTGKLIPITRNYIDNRLVHAVSSTEYSIDETKLLTNIKKSLDKCFINKHEGEEDDFDGGFSEANKMIDLYEHFLYLVNSYDIDKGILKNLLFAIRVAYGKAVSSDKFVQKIAEQIREYEYQRRKETEELIKLFNKEKN